MKTNGMAEFEQQVAEALKKPIHDDGWCVNNFSVGHEACSGRCDYISKLLAPRVAAAIHELALEYARTVEGEWGVDDPAEIRARCKEFEETALKTLRGDA